MFKALQRVLIRFCLSVFGALMERNDKRTFLLTSLYIELARIGLVKAISTEEIKREFHLRVPDDAMKLPELTSEHLWRDAHLRQVVESVVRDCDVDACVSYPEARELSACIIAKTPMWLRYDDDDMVNDILQMFYATQLPTTA